MPSETNSVKWTRGSDTFQLDETFTGTDVIEADVAVGAGVTNLLYTRGIIVANLQYLIITSDQNVTIKTNSSGAPQETIALLAGKPLLFRTGDYRTAPFAGNITAFYLTNGGAVGATVKFRGLQN